MCAAEMEEERADILPEPGGKEEKRKAVILLVQAILCYAAAAAFLLWDDFALDQSLFGWTLRVNPPGITLCVYSLAVVFVVYALCRLVWQIGSRALERLLHAAAWLGRYTLYVFLYHMLILEGLLMNLPLPAGLPRALRAALYLFVMVALPVTGKVLYDGIRRALMTGFSQKRPQALP